jgi:hypothetical protein
MKCKLMQQVLGLNPDTRKNLFLQQDKCKLPKGPRYLQIEQSVLLYKRALKQLKEFKGKILKTGDVARIARIAAELLECDSDSVRPLAQDFLNVLLDAKTFDLLAWQIAGNKKCVKTRTIALFNNRDYEQGWMAGCIIDIVKDANNEDSYAKIKLLDGPGAGFFVYAKLPVGGTGRISKITGAIKRVPGMRRYKLPSMRACIKFYVTVYTSNKVPAYSIQQFTDFKRILRSTDPKLGAWLRATQKQKNHNKALMEERARPCIKGFSQVCHECELGYDECHRSCRSSKFASKVSTPIVLTLKGKNLCPQKTLEEA